MKIREEKEWSVTTSLCLDDRRKQRRKKRKKQ